MLTQFSYAASVGINYQGRIVDGSGRPVSSASVKFYVRITGPSSRCVLFSEQHVLDMSESNGLFSFKIGQGKRTDSNTLSFGQIFNPYVKQPPTSNCPEGWTKSSSEQFLLHLSFNDGSGIQSILPLEISATPFSFDTVNVAGVSSANVLRVEGAAAAPLSNEKFRDLLDLINGVSNKYARSLVREQLTEEAIPFLSSPGKVSGSAITSGVIGGATAINTSGNLSTSGTVMAETITSKGGIGAKGDIVTDGALLSNALSTRQITLSNLSDSGRVTLSPASSAFADFSLTLPSNRGAANQVLTSDGEGGLHWQSPSSVTINTGTGLVGGPIQTSGTIRLENTTVTPGSYGSGTSVSIFTVDPQGRLTSAASTPIPVADGVSSGLLGSNDWKKFNEKLSGDSVFDGDVSGTATSLTVNRIKGQALSGVPPTDAQVLVFNSAQSQYQPTTLDGDMSFTATGLTRVKNIQGQAVSADVPTRGSFLKWSNGEWAPFQFTPCVGVNKVLNYDASSEQWNCETIDDTTKLALTGGTLSGPVHWDGYDLKATGHISMSSDKTFLLSNRSEDPVGLASSDKGTFWFDSVNKKLKYFDGSEVQTVGAVGSSLFTLNGQMGVTQSFGSPGTVGLTPQWVSNNNTHILNIPMASAPDVLAGLLSKDDYDRFAAKQNAGDYLTALTGDVTASGPGLSSASLAAVGTSGTYTKVTTDSKGRVISGTQLSPGDIPDLDASKINSGFLPVGRGGTGVGTGTSGGIPYFASSSTMASSGTLTQYGVMIGGGLGGAPSSTAAMADGQIVVGKTGQSPQVLSVGGDATLQVNGFLTVTKLRGVSLSATAPSGSGQVLRYDGSVSSWMPSFISMADLRSNITGTVAITGVGCTSNQTLTWSAVGDNLQCQDIALSESQLSFTTKTANTFLAAPSGAPGIPNFRGILSSDLPSVYLGSTLVPLSRTSGSLALTGITSIDGNAATATLATTSNNIAGGNQGSIPYQTGVGATALLPIGGAGRILSSSSTLPQWSASPVLGVNASVAGTLGFANGIAGGATITLQNPSATAAYNFNLPVTAGTAGQVLASGGGGTSPMTWLNASVTLGTTVVGLGSTTTTLSGLSLSSPNLTTPILGVASATSINKIVITPPANGATLTIGDGKTLTVNDSLSLTSGTQGGLAYFSTANTLSSSGVGTSGQVLVSGGGSAPVWSSSLFIDGVGRVGLGTTNPSANVHLKAGSSAANGAPLKFTSGTNLTTPEAGAVEYDGSNLYFTDSTATRRALATTNQISSSYVSKSGDTMTGTLNLPNNGLVIGSNQLVTSGGKVGIGTNAPAAKFHVVGGANEWAVIERSGKQLYLNANYSDGNTYAQIAPKGTDGMGLSLSSKDTSPESLFITNVGNVGLGTTSPQMRLHVDTGNSSNGALMLTKAPGKPSFGILPWESQVYFSAGTTYQAGNWIQQSDTNDNLLFVLDPGTGVSWYASDNGSGSWNVANAQVLWNPQGNWSSLIQSTRSGNSYFTGGSVGIGVSNPVAKLNVAQAASVSYPTPGLGTGSIHITPNTGTANHSSSITFGAADSGSGQTAQAGIYVQGGGSYGTKMHLATTNAYATGAMSRMMIDADGNVGIGTTAPAAKLHVSGSARSYLTGSSGGGSYVGFATDIGGLPGYPSTSYPVLRTDSNYLYFSVGGVYSGYMSAGGAITAVSDRTKKENFTPIDKADILAKIESLPMTRWNYKGESPEVQHIGPMAQDFHERFGLNGSNNTMISHIDPSGVALVGIQALSVKIKRLEKMLGLDSHSMYDSPYRCHQNGNDESFTNDLGGGGRERSHSQTHERLVRQVAHLVDTKADREEVERLRRENASLREENQEIKDRLKTIEALLRDK